MYTPRGTQGAWPRFSRVAALSGPEGVAGRQEGAVSVVRREWGGWRAWRAVQGGVYYGGVHAPRVGAALPQ